MRCANIFETQHHQHISVFKKIPVLRVQNHRPNCAWKFSVFFPACSPGIGITNVLFWWNSMVCFTCLYKTHWRGCLWQDIVHVRERSHQKRRISGSPASIHDVRIEWFEIHCCNLLAIGKRGENKLINGCGLNTSLYILNMVQNCWSPKKYHRMNVTGKKNFENGHSKDTTNNTPPQQPQSPPPQQQQRRKKIRVEQSTLPANF